jgi:hypothetical protein
MIIISIGMPRAGSGWYYNLTNDLMLACGAQDARQIRARYHLQKILTEVNCNIGALTLRRLLAIVLPSLMGNTFVIKGHAGPTPFALALVQLGWLLPTYIYRDPRDALLSAMENGRHAQENGRPNAFSPLVDFQVAMRFMQDYICISEAWLKRSDVLHTRYENLLTRYDGEVVQLIHFLGIERKAEALRNIIDKYRPESPPPDQRGLHFRQGKIGRFRTKMSFEQQEAMNHSFSAYLKHMEYPIQ